MRSLRQVVFLGVLLAVLGVAAASMGRAADSAVQQKLQGEADKLARAHFERVDGGTFEARKAEPSVMPVALDVGAMYALVAACGEGCDHVEVAIFDPAQKLVRRSPEKKDVVVIRGPALQSGAYGVVLSVPGCRAADCPAGFLLLKQAAPPDSATSASAAPAAPPMPGSPPGVGTVAPGPGADDAGALAELAKLAVTARDAARARERTASPLLAPTVTDASTAPGRPSALDGSASRPPAGAQSTQRMPGQAAAATDSCQQMAQRYAAYARTAGSPESMPQLYSMYQYLQCNCGYPPSPQLPPCSR